jgi:NAD(P)-dependent dehydrogenase (short-subunit alcohol dehydrogenase family)
VTERRSIFITGGASDIGAVTVRLFAARVLGSRMAGLSAWITRS